ncbi:MULTISPECIES: hypothetical protein [unclassified Pseudomonas]|uniref:hypothetical protein n=1 Tax=unclassified Pseudomonas TaxID=196821 RepID=UPI001CA5B3B0|nr:MULTISPECIES: hypothetical protein [unclassified Pseudomonas]
MTSSVQLNIVHYPKTPLPGTTQEQRTEALERIPPTPLKSTDIYETDNVGTAARNESDIYKATIYGPDFVHAPGDGYIYNEREAHIDAYANRVKTQIENIESGTEGERNVKFQNVRLFMDPAGYFSGGLLAAGFDPHEKFTVTFNTYVGMGTAQNLSDTQTHTYFAWEIAAGALAHDRPARGGVLNFPEMEIEKKDRTKINDLEAFGRQLQARWEKDIAAPMREGSGTIAERSGKADAYVTRGTLLSLRSDTENFARLSPAGQEAVNRTLDKNGQVIIPNIYGYPMSGYAFIPYTPYDGNTANRPNQGVMIDLKNGAVREIKGDDEFANWAKDNRDELMRRFNTGDMQGRHNAHWPPAGAVLDSLIQDNRSRYPGYEHWYKDKSVPVRELFNYTESRKAGYGLQFGDLNKGIAPHYQEQNANNAVWADQTDVFGASQQAWKSVKDTWGKTFGNLPIVGNIGNIVFGVHDSLYGKTAGERTGGTAAAVISSLMLAHEVAPGLVEASLGETPITFNSTVTEDYRWNYNSQKSEFELTRVSKVSGDSHPDPSLNEIESSGPEVPPASINVDGVELPPLKTVKNLPVGEALFSTAEKTSILSGEIDSLNTINDKLYTFVDVNKQGSAQRLNILVHGKVDETTGVAKVSYDGKLNSPEELLDTLHSKGIHPEEFDNVRLLSCDSATGGDASFAAQFQKLIGRPVKGYSGTLSANLAPEEIKAAIDKVEKIYLENLSAQNIQITDNVRTAVRAEAEQYVSEEMARIKKFKPSKSNPYWNPLKWWAFTYKPEHFPAKS